jgi:triosephosphate isomerase
MKKKLCFGNWKMHKSPREAEHFLSEFSKRITPKLSDHFALFPSPVLSGVFSNSHPSLDWGGQNCFSEKSGAFTGETSPFTLEEMGAKYCLIGHSERRHVFGETDEALNKKTKTAIEAKLIPVFCIGETEADFDSGSTLKVLKKQIDLGLKDVDLSKVIVAYEPVWAIGTGKAATPEIVKNVHSNLREFLPSTPLLYGGSVKPANSKELYNINHVDGFLIGGASLEVDSFCQIFEEMSVSHD